MTNLSNLPDNNPTEVCFGMSDEALAARLSDAHLRGIGRVTVAFGTLEFWAELGVWTLLGTDQETSPTITAEQSFKARLNLLGALAVQKLEATDSLLVNIQQFVKDAGKVEERRNQSVHSHWTVDSDGVVRRLKSRAKSKGFHQDTLNISPEHLDVLADEIDGVANSFSANLGVLLELFDVPWIQEGATSTLPGPHYGTIADR